MGYRNYNVANGFVVDKSGNGDFNTIASALTASVSGDTIFIRPGTYTENLTLKAGVNLTGFQCDAYTPSVIILGKCTATFAGSCSLSGIQLKTNSDFCLAVTGSSATLVNLKGCFIDANNNTAISFTTSSASAKIQLFDCKSDIDTTGIALFSHSSAGALKFFGGTFENDALSTTASTCSAGGLDIYNCVFVPPITTSGTSTLTIHSCDIEAPLIVGGSSTNIISNCFINGFTSSAVTVSASTTLGLYGSVVESSNTNAITGTGTLNYADISFAGSSSLINTTTQTGGTLVGGKFQAPSIGFLGERITSGFVGPTSIGNATISTLASITLTPGVWDISGMGMIVGGTFSTFQMGIGTTVSSFAGVNFGDNGFQINSSSTLSVCSGSISAFRQVITSNTTYNLSFEITTLTGSATSQGRISAVRVG